MSTFIEREIYLYSSFPGVLKPGTVSQEHFKLLIEISNIHSFKVIKALEDYYVNGKERKVACENYNVSQGYLSNKIKQLQDMSRIIVMMYPFYCNDMTVNNTNNK